MVLKRGRTGSGQASPEQAAWVRGRGVPFRFFTTLFPGSYSDQSNQPEANPIRVETGPGPCNKMVYHSN